MVLEELDPHGPNQIPSHEKHWVESGTDVDDVFVVIMPHWSEIANFHVRIRFAVPLTDVVWYYQAKHMFRWNSAPSKDDVPKKYRDDAFPAMLRVESLERGAFTTAELALQWATSDEVVDFIKDRRAGGTGKLPHPEWQYFRTKV